MKNMIPIPKFPENASLIFYHGVMRAGKSIKLLTDEHNANEFGLKTLILKPSVDTRDGTFKDEWGVMKSRVFPDKEFPAYYTQKIDKKFISRILQDNKGNRIYNRIFVDEAQFFKGQDIETLRSAIVHTLNIPVKCYGLKLDINRNWFPGSSKLFGIADTFEIPYDCEMGCGNTATMHMRFKDGKPDTDKSQVVIEQGGISYACLCGKCYYKLAEEYGAYKR